MAALNAIPMTLQKPVYSPYTFNKAYIDAAKVATVNYYVIDRLSKTYFRDTFDARQSESFVVAYGVHSKERYRYSQLSDTNKDQEVSDFEEAELDIKLSGGEVIRPVSVRVGLAASSQWPRVPRG